ncbi:MAG: class I SAM-dependent methyltransferase [Kangiellaceae bacterium]|nr:class I SAM-dependent methyltransferase [Kangiellaceae bacterium]
MSNHWEKYWSEGHLTSFCGDFEENYEDEYSTFWKEKFSEVTAGNSVLDLATGNLALPVLGLSIPKDDIKYYAVDLSKISKNKICEKKSQLKEILNKIELFDQLNIENLNIFENEKFSLISSMYGFEYANEKKVLAEVSRLLSKGGRFVAIAHSENSIILNRNNQSLRCLNSILAKKGLLDTLERMSKAMRSIKSQKDLVDMKFNNVAEKLRSQLNQQLSGLDNSYKELFWETATPLFIQNFFSSLIGTNHKTRVDWINKKRRELHKHSLRLLDLKHAAINSMRKEIILNELETRNLELITWNTFLKDGHNVGAVIELKKV